MERTYIFLVWHDDKSEMSLDDPHVCDCILGVMWDAAEDYNMAERLYEKWKAWNRRSYADAQAAVGTK